MASDRRSSRALPLADRPLLRRILRPVVGFAIVVVAGVAGFVALAGADVVVIPEVVSGERLGDLL